MQNNKYGVSKRLFIITIAKICLFFVLLVRLFYLQIREGFYFEQLSERNRTSLVPIIPKRGIIYDIFGVEIANNTFYWEALVIKSEIKQSIELFVNNIQAILYITDQDKKRIINDYNNNPAYYPILIKTELSESEIAAIETFSNNLPGVFLRPAYRRNYPFKNAMSHILGYTSLPDDKTKSNNIPNWYLGKTGIEEVMDSFLKGQVGFFKYEVDAHGRVVRRLEQSKSQVGHSITLTIDAHLQAFVYQLLSQYYSASAVVTDIDNGNILSIVSYPSFDPDLFTLGISNKEWKNLLNDDKAPLNNKPFLGLYQPGSTIKSIMLLEALQLGIIDEKTEINCKGSIKVGRDTFHCWKRSGHGLIYSVHAISESCDVYFYELAKKMKLAKMNKVAKDFGFATKQLPSFTPENQGSVIPLVSTNTLGDNIVSIIGQGKWTVTPLQLNKMISNLANNGVNRPFNILKNIQYDNKIIYPKPQLSTNTLKYDKDNFFIVRKGLLESVVSAKGTSRFASTQDEDWVLAGKSGTTQVRRITLEERNQYGGRAIANHKLPWELRDHSLFVGFVPYNHPRYAISVVVDHGGSGGIVAGGITKQIAKYLKEYHNDYISESERLNNIFKHYG